MNLSDFALKNRVITLFTLFLVVAGGVMAYFHIGKLADPVFTIKTALVVTPYPGASPHEVEQQVTRVIEEAVQAADEVKTIYSTSRAGVSMVFVDLQEYNRTDKVQQLWDILRRKVSRVQSELPSGAGPSTVYDDYSDVYGIFLALTGDGFSNAELEKYVEFIKREIMLVQDVRKINLFGIRTECINIEIDRSKCADLGIPPTRIYGILNQQNEIIYQGALEAGDYRIRINSSDTLITTEKIEDLIIQGRDEEQIRLKDLAHVSRDYITPSEPIMRFNGKPAIGLAIAAANGANVVTMGNAVQARLDELIPELPVGLNIGGVYYESQFVQSSTRVFMTNLAESIGIVIVVLLITMGLRSGLIIASNLIFSIMGTLVIMLIWGIDLQRISIAALILVMGMIVDNAIVVTEGSLVRLQRGEDRKSAISKPPQETAWPLLGATIIACLAFMPIYMAPTNVGEFCSSLFQVVSVALMISWVLAMTQTPLFCDYFLKLSPKASTRVPHSSRPYRIYRSILMGALRHRFFTILVTIGLFIIGIIGFAKVPQVFFPDSDMKQFFIDYRRPEGTRTETVSADLKKLEQYLDTLSPVESYATCVGQGPPRFAVSITPEPPTDAFGQVIVNVDDYKQINNLIHDLEPWFAENLPAGEPHIWKYINGPNADYDVEARFTGPDPQVLRNLAEKAKAIMRADPQARSICDDWRERVMVQDISYSQQKARLAAVERQDVGKALQSTTDGLIVDAYREGDELIPILLKYSSSGLDNLDTLPIWGNGEKSVPLKQVTGENEIQWEDPIIRRYDRRRVIRAQCDPIIGVTADTLLKRIGPKIEDIPLPPGYTLEWEGVYEDSMESQKAAQKFVPVMLIMMVLILVSLFNAIRQPLIILLTVPLCLVGIAAGLLLFQKAFSFLAILGTYSLIGMLIKNAVVLIDQIDTKIKSGEVPLAAVRDSSIDRMRPVMMTSLTTICGMIPLVTDELFSSMAVTIMFGLAFATVLTLIVVPVLYTLFFKIKPEG
ncbi:MAG: efflux RND transporter permease subunit [Desulfobacteraceae bacterium]|jgi:multidrug efflux pump subunit AcrB|nr:efflux RND transporter permease subunit [Desulfobacteraceae bacterium]